MQKELYAGRICFINKKETVSRAEIEFGVYGVVFKNVEIKRIRFEIIGALV